jgi:hypothetical protein
MEQARPETILAALIITESMILAVDSTTMPHTIPRFNDALQQHLDSGWKQHGAVFFIGNCPVVNLVRYDARVQPIMDKMMQMVSAQMDI